MATNDFGFHKPPDPAFPGEDEDGGVVDFASSILTYQMVPFPGRRLASVLGPTGQACEVVIDRPGIVDFASRAFSPAESSGNFVPPAVGGPFRQALPAGTRMVFDLRSLAPGRIEVLLNAAGGGPIASLDVSVKSEVVVTISTCRVTDIIHKNPFDEPAIRAAVARAKTTYRNCANVTLVEDPVIYEVESDIDLGNPIVLGKAITEYTNEPSTVFNHLRAKTPPAARAAGVIVMFGWDFELIHAPIVGLNTGRFCWVEFDTVPHNRIMTLEHELGHALGLPHTTVLSIMNGAGFNGLERFEGSEIEILNKTGGKKP